jgi:site-specific recombinase XerD
MRRFAALLSEQGYAHDYGWFQLRIVSVFSQWLDRRRITLEDVDEAVAGRFLFGRKKFARWRKAGRSTLCRLLRQLQDQGVIPPARPARLGPRDLMLEEYGEFLRINRGVSTSGVRDQSRVVRTFLSHKFGNGTVHPSILCAEDVIGYIRDVSTNLSARTVQSRASYLRGFLSYLFQLGRTKCDLSAAVPMVASRRCPQLPRYLELDQVDRLLRSCDRRTRIGKRDYAVLLLLARLGLRAGEVVHLTLEDINWRTGTLLIRGKGARVDRLPLTHDIGTALAAYLRKGRPDCDSRRVFIRHNAPRKGFANSVSVTDIVRFAMIRSGIKSHSYGAHMLRHSLATGMLRKGASLGEIGQILRHQSPQTTEIYAKVDLKALRALALPWIGGLQ